MLPNKLNVVERVHAENPGLIFTPHEFTNAVAYALWLEDPSWGHNIKRGTQGKSEDAICKLDNSSPLTVRVSGSPNNGRGIYVVDIIAGAGGPNPSPAWIDQTSVTLNQGTTADHATPHRPEGFSKPVKPVEPIPVVSSCKFTGCQFQPTSVNVDELLTELRSLRSRVDELAEHFNNIGARLIEDVNR